VRVISLFAASVLAAGLAFAASGERLPPEPSEAQMESSFADFLARQEARPRVSFTAFQKKSCKPSTAGNGHYCNFTYATALPAEQLSIFSARGTLSGTFSADSAGKLRFEMVIG